MLTAIQRLAFWSFQIINTSTALLMTLLQHLIVKGIVEAIGNFSSIYVTIIITGTVGILNYVVFLKWRE
jgi:hypothetical protein